MIFSSVPSYIPNLVIWEFWNLLNIHDLKHESILKHGVIESKDKVHIAYALHMVANRLPAT